jgi:hypothetical protein
MAWIPEGLPKQYHELFTRRVNYHTRQGLTQDDAESLTWREYYQKHPDEFVLVRIPLHEVNA